MVGVSRVKRIQQRQVALARAAKKRPWKGVAGTQEDKDKENISSPPTEQAKRMALQTNQAQSTSTTTTQQVFVVFQKPVDVSYTNTSVQTDNLIVPRKRSDSNSTKCVISGRRIISMASLVNCVSTLSSHLSLCPKGPVTFFGETNVGLACKLTFSCGCGKKFTIDSDENTNVTVNESLVWANTQSAIGYSSSRSFFATMELHPPSYDMYKKLQDNFNNDMTKALEMEMHDCAKLEYQLAVENGNMVTIEGKEYASIVVVLDGGWGKRSYRHSFSSKYGVAVIIGAKTGKVIHMGTRVSSCFVCDSKKLTDRQKKHECYKTWRGPPHGMESAILLEGFANSMQKYGLVYSKFVGDGDSSVYSKLIDIYPGLRVQKVECCNHVCRNFTTKLMDISLNTVRGKDAPKIPIEDRRIFNPKLPRFKTGLKQAIIHHNKAESHWKELYDDIMNMPQHIFGNHAHCKAYFCNGPKPKEINTVPHVSKMTFWKPLLTALERPASLAPSLVQKQTSNAAESFMSVCCKFLEGKRVYMGQSYLYNLRMAAAAFSYNESGFWIGKALELIKKADPSSNWNKELSSRLKVKARKPSYRVRKGLNVPQLAPSNFDYGDNPSKPDLPNDVLEKMICDKYTSLQLSPEQIAAVQEKTLDQADSLVWKEERETRITASNAGAIFKLRDSSDNQSILHAHFGTGKIFSLARKAMQYGKDTEAKAIMEYEKYKNFPQGYVKRAGLFVSKENGIFGASPDGLVGSEGLIEVKCPYTLFLQGKGPTEWPSVTRSSSITNKGSDLVFKKSHAHYYQVIMQMYVTGRQWVDYFIYSPHGVFCERIERSKETDKLWTKMSSKLERFWREDLAPELVNSRIDRGWSKFRCPPSRQSARSKKESKAKVTNDHAESSSS